jgi:hypothetical protein
LIFREKSKASPCELVEFSTGRWLARDHDQQPSHVIGAVPVTESWYSKIGVLEDADRVCHRQYMTPGRQPRGPAAAER